MMAGRKIRRIAHLSTHGYFDPVPELGKTDTGGQVLYVLRLARALSKFGINVDMYTRWFDPSRKQIDPLPDCPTARVIRIPAGEWEFIPKEFIYDVLSELAENMTRFIRENNLDYDLYHGHYVDAGIVALDVAKAFSKPAFFTSHSLGAWKKQRTGGDPEEMDRVFNFTHRIAEELRIFKSVKAQTVTSREEMEKIEELYNFRPERAQFIPPGVDVHLFRALEKDEKEQNTKIKLPDEYIFVISRISKVKGHDLLLPAFVRVLREFPEIHLVIAGGSKNPDEEEKEVLAHINRFIRENRITERVHIIGGIPNQDLPPYYRQAKIFILPARYEPFGMTALEAMACQVPAVISSSAGIQENLGSGKDCLIVNTLEAEEFAQAIISLLKNKTLAKNLAKAGCKTVQEEFSWEAIARRFIEFYEKHLDT
jgi:mannosylfructose-phosphate synthase